MRQDKGHKFWDKEYKDGRHLALSNNPSEDLIKFTKWLGRNSIPNPLNPESSVLDLGCGNGRNLIYMAKTYSINGVGYDISSEAISQAIELSKELHLKYQVCSIAGPIKLEDKSQDIVLDMMTSHVLTSSERENLQKEITRVLKPGGWLYLKTFLRDEDLHAKRLLRKHPAKEIGSYIHPKIGVAEHVFTEDEIRKILGKNFLIHKILRSHRNRKNCHSAIRRSISVYAE